MINYFFHFFSNIQLISIEMINGPPAYGNTRGLDLFKNHVAMTLVYPPT